MGFALSDRFPDFQKIYQQKQREADEILGFSLSHLMKEGPAEELKRTERTQPALLTLSVALSEWLRSNQYQANIVLGHSVGEYSALVAAEAIDFKNALKLVYQRGQLMDQAVPYGKGGMAALAGAKPEEAQALCQAVQQKGWLLEPAVYNCVGQIVVSGQREGIEEAERCYKAYGIRKMTPLEVSGPFHCSLLKQAGEQLRPSLEATPISEPKMSVIANANARPQSIPDEIRENLVKQVYQPVLWEDSIRYAADEGTEKFLEVGSGKVLTGLIRKILPDAKSRPIEQIETLEGLFD